MGARVSVFALSTGWPRDDLSGGAFGGAAAALAAADELFPGRIGAALGTSTLEQQLYPRHSLWLATAGTTVLVSSARLSDAVHLALRAARGRRDSYVMMHSVSDSVVFSTSSGDDDDPLARRVELHGEMDLEEAEAFAFGPELPCEHPFWAGERFVGFGPGDRPEPEELPFHPLDLGEEVLRALFGFTDEGDRLPGDLDPEDVVMYGFRWADGQDDGEPQVVHPEPKAPSASPDPSPPRSRSWWRRLLGS